MKRLDPPESWSEVIKGKRYSVKTAELIAHNQYWDGSNFDRGGRNTFLYRTQKGAYFLVTMTMWQGERNRLEPISKSAALQWWDELPEQMVEYEEAFPGEVAEDA